MKRFGSQQKPCNLPKVSENSSCFISSFFYFDARPQSRCEEWLFARLWLSVSLSSVEQRECLRTEFINENFKEIWQTYVIICKTMIPVTNCFYEYLKQVYDNVCQLYVFITGRACVLCGAQAEVRDKITSIKTDCKTPGSRYSDI